jgi:hypothetical protein
LSRRVIASSLTSMTSPRCRFCAAAKRPSCTLRDSPDAVFRTGLPRTRPGHGTAIVRDLHASSLNPKDAQRRTTSRSSNSESSGCGRNGLSDLNSPISLPTEASSSAEFVPNLLYSSDNATIDGGVGHRTKEHLNSICDRRCSKS